MTGAAARAEDGPLAAAMMGQHGDHDAMFFAHQRALLDRDLPRATALLHDYRTRLFAHAAAEERHVLPRYAAHGGDTTDAPLRLFLGEHDKLRAFVTDFAARLQAMAGQPDDRALLDLLDRQATFKNLLLHHDLRERHALYPFLGRCLPPAEQMAILAAIERGE